MHALRSGRMLALLSLLGVSLFPQMAIAHTPHDDVFAVEISPQYDRDRTIFSLVRGSLLKSEDGGNRWRRMVRGLDHKHMLHSLSLAEDGQTLFLSSIGDGVYKSEDGGERWRKVNDGLDTLNIDRVAVSPRSPDLALATGTAAGLFSTRDGGARWRRLSGSFSKVTALAFLPDRDDDILIGDHEGGLHRSDDGGTTWRKLPLPEESGAVTALAVSPSYGSDRTLIAGMEDGSVFVSRDEGRTFSEIETVFTQQPIRSIALSPGFASDGIAFASTWADGVFCSDDGGRRWRRCDQGLTSDRQSQGLGRPSFDALSVSPVFASDKTVLLGGFDGLFRSKDGGQSWEELKTLSPLYIIGVSLSPGYGQDSTIALTNMLWGAYLSRDGARSWRAANGGVVDAARGNGLTRLFAIVFSPDFPADRTLFTSTWYRLLKSTDGGSEWRQIVPVEEAWWAAGRHHGLTTALSPDFGRDGVVFIGTHRGPILKSKDGGESFALVAQAKGTVGSFAISPNFARDQTVFVADTHGVHRSSDGGETWEFSAIVDPSLHGDFVISPLFKGRVTDGWRNYLAIERGKELAVKLAISPNFATDGVVFAGTPEGLFRTGDGGENWVRVHGTHFGERGYVETVAVSPEYARDGTVLVAVRGRGLYRSEDGGSSFREVGQELIQDQILLAQYPGFIPKFPAIVFSPTFGEDKTVYGFSGTKLFRSIDRGDHWRALATPAPRRWDQAYVWYLDGIKQIRRQFKRRPRRILAGAGLLMLIVAGGLYAAVRYRRARSAP